MKVNAWALGATLVLGSLAAHAQQAPNAYVSGSLGVGKQSWSCPSGMSCDKSDTGWKLTLGIKATENIAVEGSYIDFGSAEGTISGVDYNLSFRTKAAILAGAYHFNFTPKFAAVGRLGISRTMVDAKESLNGARDADSQGNTKPYFGLAVNYAVTPQFRIEAAWDATQAEFAGNPDVLPRQTKRVDLLSIGGSYAF